jgi:hypothetical protein
MAIGLGGEVGIGCSAICLVGAGIVRFEGALGDKEVVCGVAGTTCMEPKVEERGGGSSVE